MRSKEAVVSRVEQQLELIKFLLEELDEVEADTVYQKMLHTLHLSKFFSLEKCEEKCSRNTQKKSKFDFMREMINS